MVEWQRVENPREQLERYALDQGRRSLVRLRWGLRIAALVGLGLLEIFYVLALDRTIQEVLLDLFWGALLSLGLIQICFFVVFRLYDRAVNDQQSLATHLVRLHRLYALSRRLTASLPSDAVLRDVDEATAQAHTEALALDHREMRSALEGLVELYGAMRGSLLLLDEKGQPQEFINVGLAPDARPGPRPAQFSAENAPVTDLNSPSWCEYLMPGAGQVGAFVAVPIVAGERLWGYLALAGGSPLTSQDRSLLHTFAANIGVVLDNALLFQETQLKLVESATLTEVSHRISSKLTREELLPLLAESLTRILGSTGCLIMLRHSYSGELELAAVYGPYTEEDQSLLTADGYVSLACASMETREPVAVGDVGASDYVASELMEQLPDKSLLSLPLIVQGQSVGAVVIGEARERRQFSEEEIGRAMVVVNQGAVSIANAQLFREVERRLVELGTLAEISRVIFSQLHAPDIYQRVVDELARAFGYPFIAFYYAGEGRLELGAQKGYGTANPPAHISLGQGLVGDAATTGQMGYIPDTSVFPDVETAAEGVVSQIALPLRKNGRVLGVLIVESYTPLTEADLSLLQSLSYQVTMVVENARLYAAEQREREVAGALLQIAGDLSGTLHLDEVLNLILERLRVVLPYDSAAIGLLAGEVCYVAAAHDLPRARRLWGDHLAPNDLPLVARVLEKRSAIIITDTSLSDDWVVVEGVEGIRSWLGVPLVVQDRTIGLLMLNHSTPEFYGQDAARLALAFAQHAALAIDNARLYEQVEATLREQTLLHEMTTAVSSTLDAGRVFRLLAERLVTVLGVTSARIATLDDERQSANLVIRHSSADADEAESGGEVAEVYDLASLPVTAERLMARQPLQVTAGADLAEWRERMQQRAGQSMLLLPLVARDRVTGFVELWDSRSQRYFTEAEIALAQTLINPAAVAIDNARLFAETQRRFNDMTLLYDMAVAVGASLELDTVLQSVVKTLQFRVLEKSVVNVWLFDADEDVLRLRAHAGQLEGLPSEELMRLDQGLCGRVVRSGQPVLVSDAQQRPDCVDYGPAVHSVLCVPLASGQRVVGVLEALSVQKAAYTSDDLRLLRAMAGSLAFAVENVRLFTQLRHSEEALVLRNRALKRANDRLQELDRLKSAFIASVSHELRTPLNSIIGFSEVMLDGLAGDLEVLAQEYLGYIHGSGKHLLDLINDILDLSRIQAGRMTLQLAEVDVMALIEEVQATLAPLMEKKNQTFVVERGIALSNIIADRFRLKQILINLVGNACKFTQEGGQILARAGMIDARTFQLDVIDNGPGIALEDQALIFEEFRQARATRPGEGTGLGLAITRRLVHMHGGRIWVESELGVGATFTVLFPVAGPEVDETDQNENGTGGGAA